MPDLSRHTVATVTTNGTGGIVLFFDPSRVALPNLHTEIMRVAALALDEPLPASGVLAN